MNKIQSTVSAVITVLVLAIMAYGSGQMLEYKEQINQMQVQIETLEAELNESTNQLQTHEKTLNKVTSENEQLQSQLTEAQETESRLRDRIEEQVKRLSEMNKRIKEHATAVSTIPSRGNSNVTSAFLNVEATAYTAYCKGCSGTTYAGINLRQNPDAKVVAVDPNVIPLGSKVYIEGMGYFLAADIGGAIKGHRIDIFMPEKSEALKFGRQKIKIKVIQ